VSHIGHSDRKKDAMLLSIKLHVDYIRRLEQSDRVRAACLKYLHIWLINFYPERPDIVEDLNRLAGTLEGRLETPRLRWKYAWLRPLLGWDMAKSAQIALPELKGSLMRRWDKTMYQLENRLPLLGI
jgi:hypothetical protein